MTPSALHPANIDTFFSQPRANACDALNLQEVTQ